MSGRRHVLYVPAASYKISHGVMGSCNGTNATTRPRYAVRFQVIHKVLDSRGEVGTRATICALFESLSLSFADRRRSPKLLGGNQSIHNVGECDKPTIIADGDPQSANVYRHLATSRMSGLLPCSLAQRFLVQFQPEPLPGIVIL